MYTVKPIFDKIQSAGINVISYLFYDVTAVVIEGFGLVLFTDLTAYQF